MPGNCRYGWTVRRKCARIKRRSKCLYQTTMPTWSIFNLATFKLGGLKGLQLSCTSVWKNKHCIYVRNDDSSGFSEQRKSIASEFIQRCHPTFFTLYVLVLTFLCHASVIDAFDPKLPTVNVYLWINKFEFFKKSSAWIFQRPNHFSTGSEQMHACVLLFMLKNKKKKTDKRQFYYHDFQTF